MGFALRLHQGYNNRKYDIDKKKIEDFIDRFFRFIFFLEYQRCSEPTSKCHPKYWRQLHRRQRRSCAETLFYAVSDVEFE